MVPREWARLSGQLARCGLHSRKVREGRQQADGRQEGQGSLRAQPGPGWTRHLPLQRLRDWQLIVDPWWEFRDPLGSGIDSGSILESYEFPKLHQEGPVGTEP